jgi:hypothetical protein
MNLQVDRKHAWSAAPRESSPSSPSASRCRGCKVMLCTVDGVRSLSMARHALVLVVLVHHSRIYLEQTFAQVPRDRSRLFRVSV